MKTTRTRNLIIAALGNLKSAARYRSGCWRKIRSTAVRAVSPA